ncbi:MAG: hypothetical protein Q9195_001678 [Heterodermia aff. obscurata]
MDDLVRIMMKLLTAMTLFLSSELPWGARARKSACPQATVIKNTELAVVGIKTQSRRNAIVTAVEQSALSGSQTKFFDLRSFYFAYALDGGGAEGVALQCVILVVGFTGQREKVVATYTHSLMLPEEKITQADNLGCFSKNQLQLSQNRYSPQPSPGYGPPVPYQPGPYEPEGYSESRRSSKHHHRRHSSDSRAFDRRYKEDYVIEERREKRRSRDHSREKGLASTLAGAAGGGYLGHKIGGGAIGTVGGLVAGAIGARELEKRHER